MRRPRPPVLFFPVIASLLLACTSPSPGPLHCPPGTEALGAAPPLGEELWCERRGGERHGPSIQFEADGGWIRGAWLHGLRHGIWRAHRPDGSRQAEESYRRGMLQGSLRGWHANGQPAFQGSAEADVTVGLWTEWYANGRKRSEAELRGDLLVGRYLTWHRNGAPEFAGRFAAGREEGLWKRWWPNGPQRSQWTMRAGQHHGPVRAWYPSGALRMQGQRHEGSPHGVWLFWDEAGQLSRRAVYEGGRELSTANASGPGR